MKELSIYASRPRHVYKTTDDTKFFRMIDTFFKSTEILAEGIDFNYIKSLYMDDKIEKIITKHNFVAVLHYNGVVDKYQYLEICQALINRKPIFATDIKSNCFKKVVGFEKIFNSGVRRYATLNLKNFSQ